MGEAVRIGNSPSRESQKNNPGTYCKSLGTLFAFKRSNSSSHARLCELRLNLLTEVFMSTEAILHMPAKRRRGFAAMDPAKKREVSRRGGKAAQLKGTAHRFTKDEARAAGRKGGLSAQQKGTAHRFTTE